MFFDPQQEAAHPQKFLSDLAGNAFDVRSCCCALVVALVVLGSRPPEPAPNTVAAAEPESDSDIDGVL